MEHIKLEMNAKLATIANCPQAPLLISYLLVSSLSLCNGFVKVISRGNLPGQTFIHLGSGVEEHNPILRIMCDTVLVFVLHVHKLVCVCVCVCVCVGGG